MPPIFQRRSNFFLSKRNNGSIKWAACVAHCHRTLQTLDLIGPLNSESSRDKTNQTITFHCRLLNTHVAMIYAPAEAES